MHSRKKNRNYLVSCMLCLAPTLFLGCATTSHGANWATADLDKYNLNYKAFDTTKLTIGQSKDSIFANLPKDFKVVEAGENYEVLAFSRLRSVPGPDIEFQILKLRIENHRLKSWVIEDK